MIDLIEKYPRTVITLVLVIMLGMAFPALEVTIMEARNFITAREMVNDGNWLLTTMNGAPRYEKPPLPTWLSALSGSIFGLNTKVAMRLPALLMVITLSLTFFELLKQFKLDIKQVIMGTFVLVTSFYVLAIIIEAPWDIFTHGFSLLSILFYVRFFQRKNGYWSPALAAGLCLGLSILSKGPIGFFALWLPFLISYVIVYKPANWKQKWAPFLISIITAILVGGWWYYYVRIADPATLLAITAKETNNWSSYNVRPFYYYWSFFTQSGLWTIPAFVALLYPYLKHRVSNVKVYRFAWLWTLSAVILLSIIPEKKSRYLMPVLIPLAFNTSFYIDYLRRQFKDITDKREWFPVVLNFSLIALIGILFGIIIWWQFEATFIAKPLLVIVLGIILLGCAIGIITHLKRKRFHVVFYTTLLFYIALFSLGAPLSSTLKGNAYKPISDLRNQLQQEALNLYGFNYVAPEVIWQYGEKIPAIKTNDSTYHFPEVSSFAMIANGISPKDQELLRRNYEIEKLEAFDLNVVDSTSKKYRSRLYTTLYYLRKK